MAKKKVRRFMQTVDEEHWGPLEKEAEAKYPGIGSVQKLIRFNVIPDWVKKHKDEN